MDLPFSPSMHFEDSCGEIVRILRKKKNFFFLLCPKLLVAAAAVVARYPQEARSVPGALDCIQNLEDVTFLVVNVLTGEVGDCFYFFFSPPAN